MGLKPKKWNLYVDLASLCLCVLGAVFFFFAWHQIYPSYMGWDQPLYVNVIASLANGNQTSTMMNGAHFLSEHCHFIAYLLVPIYKIFPHPLTLEAIKIIAFFAGAFILYCFAKRKVMPIFALLIMLAYIIHPVSLGLSFFPFIFEPLAIPFIFLMFLSYDKRDYTLFIISAIFICATKEHLPIIVMLFGIVHLFKEKEYRIKWGLVPFILGAAFLFLDWFIVLKFLRQDFAIQESIQMSRRYSHIGNSLVEIGINFIKDPSYYFSLVAQPEQRDYLYTIFGPTMTVSLLNFSTLLIGIPLLLKNLISSSPLEKSIFSYYPATFLPFVFISLIYATDLFKKYKKRILTAICVLLLMHAVVYFKDFKHEWAKVFRSKDYNTWDTIHKKISDQIPKNASVMASTSMLAKVAHRENVYPFWYYIEGVDHMVTGKPFHMPKDLEYVLLNLYWPDALLGDQPEKFNHKIRSLYFSKFWKPVYALEETLLLARSSSKQKEIDFLKSFKPTGSELDTPHAIFDNNLNLAKFDAQYDKENNILKASYIWKLNQSREKFYEIKTMINAPGIDYVNVHRVGSYFYPSVDWNVNNFVREVYYYHVDLKDQKEFSLKLQTFHAGINAFHSCQSRVDNWMCDHTTLTIPIDIK